MKIRTLVLVETACAVTVSCLIIHAILSNRTTLAKKVVVLVPVTDLTRSDLLDDGKYQATRTRTLTLEKVYVQFDEFVVPDQPVGGFLDFRAFASDDHPDKYYWLTAPVHGVLGYTGRFQVGFYNQSGIVVQHQLRRILVHVRQSDRHDRHSRGRRPSYTVTFQVTPKDAEELALALEEKWAGAHNNYCRITLAEKRVDINWFNWWSLPPLPQTSDEKWEQDMLRRLGRPYSSDRMPPGPLVLLWKEFFSGDLVFVW